MRWPKNSLFLVLTLTWMLNGCAARGVALRSGTTAYLAADKKVDAFLPDEDGVMTRCQITLPAGSMFQTSPVTATPAQMGVKSE